MKSIALILLLWIAGSCSTKTDRNPTVRSTKQRIDSLYRNHILTNHIDRMIIKETGALNVTYTLDIAMRSPAAHQVFELGTLDDLIDFSNYFIDIKDTVPDSVKAVPVYKGGKLILLIP